MNHVRQLALLVFVIASSAACGGEATKLTPTAAPTATSTPEPAVVGPILVYTKETPFEQRMGQVDTFVVAYDVGAGREILQSTIPQVIVPILNRASGEVLYLGQSKDRPAVRAVNIMTGAERIVYQSQRPLEFRVALSPDGASLAVSEVESETDVTSHTHVRVVDLADGSARTVATFGNPLAEAFRGRPVPFVWRDDGRGFVVAGDTSSGAPGTWGTVMLDGTVRTHFRDFAYPSPSGRMVALDDVGEMCVTPGVQRLRLFDLDANAEVARVEDPGRGIFKREWSPEGDALLYDQLSPTPGTENDPCRPTYETASRRSFLLRASGGPPELVGDVDTLLARWHPEARINLTCVYPATDLFDTCFGPDKRNLSINGTPVDVGENIRIVGFLHNPN
jgi:hypothetical protein